jgi:hypothetical protein
MPKLLKHFFVFQCFIVLSTIVFTILNKDEVIVDVELDSSIDSSIHFFWDSGSGFNVVQSTSDHIFEGANHIRIKIYDDIKGIHGLRLDPISHYGHFSIDVIQLENAACLFFIEQYCSKKLSIDKAMQTEGLEKIENQQHQYMATTQDPMIVWGLISDSGNHKIKILVVNLLLVMGGASLLWGALAFLERGSGFRKQYLHYRFLFSSGLLLLIYPVVYIAFWFAHQYINLTSFNSAFFIVSLLLFVAYFLFPRHFIKKRVSSSYIFVASIIIILISPDFLYHLGVANKVTDKVVEPWEYHWRLGRSFDDNYEHSSLKYIEDIENISKQLPPKSVVLSDTATSYYLTAMLDVFVRNPLFHHKVSGSIKDDDLVVFCNSNTQEDAVDVLTKYDIEFMVINYDENNPNVDSLCSGQKEKVLANRLETEFDLLYQGQYMSLYRLVY